MATKATADHPETGRPAVAFVAAGPVKRAHLWARPQVTVTFRRMGYTTHSYYTSFRERT
jgi:hypothetical protein